MSPFKSIFYKIIFSIIILEFYGCNFNSKNDTINPLNEIELNDIQAICKNLSKGNYTFPLISEFKKGKKQLVYIGVSHSNDTLNPMFDSIQKYFNKLKPNISLNEGGKVSDTIRFKTKNEYIHQLGELYYLKYLSNNAGIKMINADCSDIFEYTSLLKKFDRKSIYYFYTIQRFLPQFLSGYSSNKVSENVNIEFNKFVEKAFVRDLKMKLSKEEMEWAYFEKAYKYFNNEEIDLENYDQAFSQSYLTEKSKIGDLARYSLIIRDRIIITNIYKALQKYDRVFIVFGGFHLLTQKPSLDKMFAK